MRSQASQILNLQSTSRPKGRVAPFFRLRSMQRYKGVGRFRLLQLFSVKNLTLLLIVFAFMLIWSKQTGFAPSLDFATTQILTPTQHVFNISDTLLSNHQEASSSNGGVESEQSSIQDTKVDSKVPPIAEQTDAKLSSFPLIETSKNESNAQPSKFGEKEITENSISGEDTKGREEDMKVDGGDISEGNEVIGAQLDAPQKPEERSNAQQDPEKDFSLEVRKEELPIADRIAAREAPAPVKTPKPLAEVLNFTPATAINFMHFHKTGGVSFKTSLHKFYYDKFKGNGEKVQVQDACYSREGVQKDSSTPSFLVWRCDWDPIREKNEEERNKIDFTFGHQFWGNGVGDLLNHRDVRSFTIMRHPFDRKVSFYFHFFVREVGRKEEDVTYEEIRDFLLYDKLVIKADLGRDLGPNYMAGRLLSDGIRGYVGNNSFRYYDVEQDKKYDVSEEALDLIRGYVFVGLQAESGAAKCMLKKVVELFNQVNGVDNIGLELIDDGAKKLNSGSYSLDAGRIWSRFSAEEKITFDRKERVDLLIYEEGERLFQEHVQLFGCGHRVVGARYQR
ncbi:unnamed protein product [Agarophyton chilense]